jgi:murein DD-endopeptidase MepM/ murein hydrolase activator NlpD
VTSASTTSTLAARPTSSRAERPSGHATASDAARHSHHHTTTQPARSHRSSTRRPPTRRGVLSARNPTYSLSLPSAPLVGVPNFFIDSFEIPPFLLPIYQAAGIEYQVPWEVLAAINEIETDYGRNLSVSSAGAVGWMQFLPSTWRRWGVDANGDGVADPYNPVDAIFTAARYLHAAGASQNLSRAIYAYNHADWYVQSVLLRAKLLGGIPSQLIGALTGLVQGHFPVAAPATYADDAVISRRGRAIHGDSATETVDSDSATDTEIFARRGSPVIAVNDGKIIKLGHSVALGNYVELQDSTGNVYTYSQLGTISRRFASPKPVRITRGDLNSEMATPKVRSPSGSATAGRQIAARAGRPPATATVNREITAEDEQLDRLTRSTRAHSRRAARSDHRARHNRRAGTSRTRRAPRRAPMVKERLFARPARIASYAAGGRLQLQDGSVSSFDDYFADTLHLTRGQYTLKRLKVGSIVIGGTILGRVGRAGQGVSSHLTFAVQPAGKGAPHIDPKPILDGWKLLQATAVYRANDIDPFYGPGERNPSVGQVLLMSKQQLTTRVLTDPHVRIYTCGRRDIQAGLIDRRILAVIEFLSASGLDPTVSGLLCDASPHGTTGVDEAGRTGESVDISAVNGIPILGHQGPGSITQITIRRLLALQGSMAPDDIVSDTPFKGQGNTLALPDHTNRIQVTYVPAYGANRKLSDVVRSYLKPGQWTRLIDRISQIPEPTVPLTPSRYAIRDSARR